MSNREGWHQLSLAFIIAMGIIDKLFVRYYSFSRISALEQIVKK